MWLEGLPILDVVHADTNFKNATVLRGKSASDVWQAFVGCWATIDKGYPNIIPLHQESGFPAASFRDLAAAHDNTLQFSGAQFHNPIVSGEKYYSPLRRVFHIIRDRHNSLKPEVALRYAVKGLNDTMVPAGHVPSVLVFGTLPTFPILNKDIPGYEDLIKALRIARDEVASVRAEQAIRREI